jgi:ElaB/YqjD/DUF883 family membrane-anchored ribosome-binding protein
MNSNPELMDSMDDTIQPPREAASRAGRAGTEIRNLLADVEELIRRVAHLDDADLARAREKLERRIAATRASLHNGTERVRTTARQAATTTDTYVHDNPWSAIGIAAAAGAAIAVLLSMSTRFNR